MQNPTESGVRFREIARQLKEEIFTGRYGQDGRLPSEAQLVRKFGVSRPTVAKSLGLLRDEGLIERRAGSGSFVKQSGRSSAGSNLLALLVPKLGNTEIFQTITGEIASLARLHNYSLVLGGSEHLKADEMADPRQIEQLCRQFIESKVSGVFFAPHELAKDHERANRMIVETLREAGILVVLLDRDLAPFPARSDFDLIGVDNFAGGHLLGEHLLKLGCTRIHFVARPFSAPTVDARIAGVREALAGRGISPDPGWVRIGDLDDRKFIRQLSGPFRPDAFVCANDHTAALLMRELQKNHLRVPDDVRVVGFDDVKFSTLVSPALTTIQQPCREIGATAFHTMMGRLAEPTLPARHLSLAPRLIVRDSCGAYLRRIKAT